MASVKAAPDQGFVVVEKLQWQKHREHERESNTVISEWVVVNYWRMVVNWWLGVDPVNGRVPEKHSGCKDCCLLQPFEARTVQSRAHMHCEGCVYTALPFKQNHGCCGAPSPRECRQKSCPDLKLHGGMQSNRPNSQCQMPLGQGSC
jgi:hypothetical protein